MSLSHSNTLPRRSLPPWRRWAVVVLWLALIFFMSSRSDSGQQSGFLTQWLLSWSGAHPEPAFTHSLEHLLRKAAHFSEYAILAGLLYWALPPQGLRRYLLAWSFAVLYAASDEWHQSFVPHRGPSPKDVLIDASGAAFALLVLAGWRRWRNR